MNKILIVLLCVIVGATMTYAGISPLSWEFCLIVACVAFMVFAAYQDKNGKNGGDK